MNQRSNQEKAAQAACREAVLRVTSQLGLKPGDAVSLFDLDTTIYEPDGYGFMVDNFTRRPEKWHAIDRAFNDPNSDSKITLRELFQLALDMCHDNPGFSIAAAVDKIKGVHYTLPGTQELVDVFNQSQAPVIAITNGIVNVAEPLLAHHELAVPAIGNWVEYRGGRPVFMAIHGDNGLDKLLVARTFVELGFRVAAGAGDSKSDIGLAQVAVENGGIVLARADKGLARWCAANLPADSWRPYGEFCEPTRHWVRAKLGAKPYVAA